MCGCQGHGGAFRKVIFGSFGWGNTYVAREPVGIHSRMGVYRGKSVKKFPHVDIILVWRDSKISKSHIQ